MEVVVGGGEVSVGQEPVGYASVVQNLGRNNKRPRERDDRTPANNLARHNSSPVGLFSSIDVETGSCSKLSSFDLFKVISLLGNFFR